MIGTFLPKTCQKKILRKRISRAWLRPYKTKISNTIESITQKSSAKIRVRSTLTISMIQDPWMTWSKKMSIWKSNWFTRWWHLSSIWESLRCGMQSKKTITILTTRIIDSMKVSNHCRKQVLCQTTAGSTMRKIKSTISRRKSKKLNLTSRLLIKAWCQMRLLPYLVKISLRRKSQASLCQSRSRVWIARSGTCFSVTINQSSQWAHH